uniref:Uncharacterized protein n=1 Tax=Anopheles albimanus TaxID=7167 RepID=A0A182FI31_ANOAL
MPGNVLSITVRDCYPRVLEHIISTQPPQVLCRDYKEILGTLDIISTDPEADEEEEAKQKVDQK